eukprot:IDg18878t1
MNAHDSFSGMHHVLPWLRSCVRAFLWTCVRTAFAMFGCIAPERTCLRHCQMPRLLTGMQWHHVAHQNGEQYSRALYSDGGRGFNLYMLMGCRQAVVKDNALHLHTVLAMQSHMRSLVKHCPECITASIHS